MSSRPKRKPEPLPNPKADDPSAVPSVVVFFVTRAQRTRILRSLRQLSDDRTRALLIALGEASAGEGVVS